MPPRRSRTPNRFPWLLAIVCALPVGLMGAAPTSPLTLFGAGWEPFGFVTSAAYGYGEKLGLLACLVVAVAGLGYAASLMKQVYATDAGTPAMQVVAKAVRDGANAYLRRQFTVVGLLIVVLTAVITASKWPWELEPGTHSEGELRVIALGRGAAFFIGALFSAAVGFTGMRLATAGNLRVAAAARNSFGEAMRLAYKTGTITGMFTCGLGLLGGALILLVFGELAYEILIGYGFGGSLLALFMRVGGGIYTKAADVGADLVGKVEKSMAEDDPRNAATIADNVGDNVGDCAGMAADVFESYSVTMVAAVMLGYAAFGYKGMIFPLLVQAVGVIGSMISTSLVGRGMTTGNAATAMKSINLGFWRSAAISTVGFLLLGAIYLQFDAPYIVERGIEKGLYQEIYDNAALREAFGLPAQPASVAKEVARLREKRSGPERNATDTRKLEEKVDGLRVAALAAWHNLDYARREELAGTKVSVTDLSLTERGRLKEYGHALPEEAKYDLTLMQLAQVRYHVPLSPGLNMRVAFCCLIGIVLAVLLNKCTEYWTSTEYSPVQEVVKASRTGHATNIISGLALGLESSVWAVLIISAAIFGSVYLIGHPDHLLFMAFGVAMCGIGMLTLTGDTISMDVFGPIADNANGIGEMAFNKGAFGAADLKEGEPGYLSPEANRAARQILADLDAVGNTTKAITKGIAIGSAVIAAVSLFASFIAVLVTGSEEKIGQLLIGDFTSGASKLTVAEPLVFIGMLIGGAVPFLFSAMTIRAVGRAAYLIVYECRRQFNDPDIMAGKKLPDYGRVVGICTATAQKELIGPGLLAIGTPLVVGFLLGPFALGGFLAGMILSGQLMAVFMSNAGGSWDNAKKMIEDEPRTDRTGKGSEKHKASVTGDTVGDPLKDTSGPAINPLIKVMNMVSLLALPLVILHNVKDGTGNVLVGGVIAGVSALLVGWAWWKSKHESAEVKQMDAEMHREETGAKPGA
ncbi:potassium transporter : K(+)-insensitive pyrophosphate-energized proton pump OS=Singulisphaera acidiphila (strain ATCC BAA-1392 / DSM 18658 / VKM B-2454 / MOB10) GN=hppA PE=3 SV=1: H_PPase: H_PPase [Gemmataceae bacterium]|nr:potassium transporter : K(+)-insensitive pyrophosphate-energized proton pump OS=Singulisphaera acidiphila (strain ATCC BAA-1392 / DSM 18658 / VKM B-2454 / MOB10) GN=hppA PE=3 SV=1: H_PPase: H_PPase [Gemmataceae bacterium]VTU02155.1 potassium transporter : K(+)-insensitive pyrophosphate-energized proton pump OS=Singulisphaera acidiphila (strain ATCC BAA-1392 / DSM 18658 / VKM B-2454 / MOB10) GN=hppA PE=3 SV=1: H_PPase: H_PPase [Gemmataceae bacterium]